MRASAVFAFVSVLGCGERQPSSSPTSSPEPAAAVTPTVNARAQTSVVSPAAQRIYMLGEERYADGRYPEAVALWGHAMLQLPSDPAADELRHALLTRMGHGLLQAYRASDDPAYLHDAKQMCDLYLLQHQALFGDTERARAERGEVYELLFEIEWRLEHEAGDAEADGSSEPSDERLDLDSDALVADAGGVSVGPADETTDDETADDETADDADSSEDDYVRFVKVRRVQWARFEDPRVIAFMQDPSGTGPSLLGADPTFVHGPRVLVRPGALPRALTDEPDAPSRRTARRIGLDVIEAARPELRRCYEVAMGRDPVMTSRVEVELVVDPNGRITQPRVVGGSLIDAQGDACLAKALRDTVLDQPELDQTLAVWLALQIFQQDAVLAPDAIGGKPAEPAGSLGGNGDVRRPAFGTLGN